MRFVMERRNASFCGLYVWIEQFVEGVDFGICGFLLIACIVLLLIIGCVVFKAWRIANENPVDSIKSE